MKKIATFLILFLAPFFLEAQQLVTNYKDLGDKSFTNKDYYAASVYYQKAINEEQNGNEDKPYQGHNTKLKKAKIYSKANLYYQLAESFRLYRNYVNAGPWYYKLLEQPEAIQYPLARLWYGVCLRATQQFDESIKQLDLFLASNHADKSYDEHAKKEIANCNFAKKQYEFPKAITITKMPGNWNSDGSNYSLSQKGNNEYWLTSSRYTTIENRKKNRPHLNRIFFAAKNSSDSASLKEIQFNNSPFEKEGEWGTPALDPTGKHLYFTYWFKKGKEIFHAIYQSVNAGNNQWSVPEKLNINVNVEGFNAIQPFVTQDGKQLYFASNKPGSIGGYDLWVSELDDSGNPLPSVNLGNAINTSSDEQAPYYNVQQKKLIYSSKGFIGLGGFDFMESLGTPGKWAKPENMGYPMNSAKDDLYYAVDPEEPSVAYISSDRQSECCLELFTVKSSTFIISGLVEDCDLLKPLYGATVTLVNLQTKQNIKQVTTGLTGKYKFEVEGKQSYRLRIEKNTFFTKVITVTPVMDSRADTLINNEACLRPFKVGKPIVLKDIFFDYKKADLRAQSKIQLDTLSSIMKDNPDIRIELSAHTDSIGSNSYNLKLSQARAQSCVDYLIQTGIKTERIFAKGYGETKPVAPNTLPNGKDNPAGRQLNRRTEFTVL